MKTFFRQAKRPNVRGQPSLMRLKVELLFEDMMKILNKIDRWVFGRTGGKIIVGFLALFGTVSLVAAVVRYNHAYKIVKDARWRAEQAAEEWRGHPISRNVVFKD